MSDLLPIVDQLPTAPTLLLAKSEFPLINSTSLTNQTFRVHTLGCKVNQYESQYLRELLRANGYREAEDGEHADLSIVNTCTVTEEADRKGRHLIRKIARLNPGAQTIVTGCYATRRPNEVAALPQVAGVLTDKQRLAEDLAPFGISRRINGIRRFDGHHRAFLKVQDGCLLNCTYCIIPQVRPSVTSRTIVSIRDEAQALVNAGFKEIVLTGIHLGHYGIDLSRGLPKKSWQRLWHLLEDLCQMPGEFRIRLSSLEAAEVTDDFIRVLADYQDRICPHYHLCLQSGSDRILRAMKRRYTVASFLHRCDKIRSVLDHPAFATDIIVGFPGETSADFASTLATARQVGFAKIHVFPFSPRQGTPAAEAAEQPEPVTQRSWVNELDQLGHELAQNYWRSLLGRKLSMLVESPDPNRPGWMRGTACRGTPLRLQTLPALAFQLVPVVAARIVDDAVLVEPLPE